MIVRQDATARKISLGVGYLPREGVRLDVAGGVGDRDFSLDRVAATNQFALHLTSRARAPWNARVRLGVDLADDLSAHAYYGYARDDFSFFDSTTTTADTTSITQRIASERALWREDTGFSLNFRPSPDYSFFVGAAYETEHRQGTTRVDGSLATDLPQTLTLSPLLVVGAEVGVFRWLGFRVGARKAFTYSERDSLELDETNYNFPTGKVIHLRDRSFPTVFTVGARLSIKRLEVDTLFNEQLPFQLGFYETGNTGVIPVLGISATYRFGSQGSEQP
jgi:hypothetical protein